MIKGKNMNNFNNELKSLDQELNRYQRKIEKIRFLVAYRLIKRVRSGIPITDEKLLLKWNDMIHNIMGPYQMEERNKNKKIIVKNVGDEVSIKEAMKDIDNKKI